MTLHSYNLSKTDTLDLDPDNHVSGLPEFQRNFSDLDLESEIVSHYQKAKLLRDDVQYADDVPANQKAQVFNSLTATLDKLVQMQNAIHNSERQKQVEQCLVSAMRGCPAPVQDKFFQEFDRLTRQFDRKKAVVAKLNEAGS